MKVAVNTHAHMAVELTFNIIQIPEIWRRHEMKYMNVRQVHKQTIFPVRLSKLLLHPQTVFLFFFWETIKKRKENSSLSVKSTSPNNNLGLWTE